MLRRIICMAVVFFVVGVPVLGQVTGPEQLGLCDQGRYTVVVTNRSGTQSACRIVVLNSVPDAGYAYVPGSSLLTLHDGRQFSDDPVGDTWDIDAITSEAYVLPPDGTLTLAFDLATDCSALSGTDIATIRYEDCSAPGVLLEDTGSISIEILPGALTLTKTPSVVEASVGDEVTWVITVDSTGLGPIRNVTLRDVLGSGLELVSASDGATNSGQTTMWTAASTPSLETIAAGESASVTITAIVVACEGLVNEVFAEWGCGNGEVCSTTAEGTSAAVSLVTELPFLEFEGPVIAVPYCEIATPVSIPIENSGEGTARNVRLCGNLNGLIVSNLPPGVTYDGSCFEIPVIEGESVYDLSFDVGYSGDWCAGDVFGTVLFLLSYENDCGNPHRAQPQFGTIEAASAPAISVSKSGPQEMRLGEDIEYEILVVYSEPRTCRGGSTSDLAIVVDTYPEGFSLLNADGGVHDPEARTITWTYDPMIDPVFGSTVQFRAPTACGACAGPNGGTDPNTVTVYGTDCCGCPIASTASVPTTILCEGYVDGTEYFRSSISLSRDVVVRCSLDYAVTVTHTYTFADEEALDGLLANEFVYFVDLGSDFQYVPASSSVTGATLDTVDVVSGRLELQLADGDSVRGRTIEYSYDLVVVGLDDPSCVPVTYPIQSGIDLALGATEIAFCGPVYADPPAPTVVAQPPAMSVVIDGVPVIQEDCGSYLVSVSLERTSDLAVPYDVALTLENRGSSSVDLAGIACGGVTPGDGTSCTAPEIGADSFTWRFGDGFASANQATLTIPVTAPCGGPLIDLVATAVYDDACQDDGVYGEACSVSASAQAELRLEGRTCLQLRPEQIYATEREVTWTICVTNTFNATAYNVWVDDVLGSGLRYATSTVNPSAGVAIASGADHSGTAINGASWKIDAMAPGEKREITVTTELVGCDDLVVTASTAWGCDETNCQPAEVSVSSVRVAPANLVATSFSPTPVDICTLTDVTISFRNAGASTVYDLVGTVELPTGLSYSGNAQVRVDDGGWTPIADPSTPSGSVLVWTENETALLDELVPRSTLQIRFEALVDCAFTGGDVLSQAGYTTACGASEQSDTGRFRLASNSPELSISKTQISPADGEPIPCLGEVTWRIQVTNIGEAAAPIVRVVDTLDAGWTYLGSTGDGVHGPSDGGWNDGGQTTIWEIADLGIGETATATLTARSAVLGPNCYALGNQVNAFWGCGAPDGNSSMDDSTCLAAFPVSDSTTATRPAAVDPILVAAGAIESCSGLTTLTGTISNTSSEATAFFVDLVFRLPPGLSYLPGSTQIQCPGGGVSTGEPAISGTSVTGQTLTWYDLAQQGSGFDACDGLGPGEDITVTLSVSSACFLPSQRADVEVLYFDCCDDIQHAVDAEFDVPALYPELVVTKTPSESFVDCGDPTETVVWTITVENQGTGTAGFVRIEDILGSDLIWISGGTPITTSLDGAPLSNAFGWEFGPLGVGESRTFTLEASLSSPLSDCAPSRRRNTARASWGCFGTFTLDEDPGTTDDYFCSSGIWSESSAAVTVPNLSIAPADIVPQFDCTNDGISPDTGQIHITVQNTGDAPITSDFAVSVEESTTGLSVTGSYAGLGGQLPLDAGARSTIVVENWAVACGPCSYSFGVVLDTGNAVCECDESDNEAVQQTTITIPDLLIAGADVEVSCDGDGRIRVQGPVTLRNDGCGDPLTGTVRLRFRLYDAADCAGTQIDTFTVNLTNLTLPANGGTQERTINVTRSLDVCDTCVASIGIEADDNDSICECDGTNNVLCAGTFPIAFPDLAVTDIDFSQISCVSDSIVGTVRVTVQNDGCGASGPFDLRLETDGCLSFDDETVTGLGSGTSTTINFAVTGDWSDCADCSCTFTATIDPVGEICECDGTNNELSVPYTSPTPDLEIPTATASLACASDGESQVLVNLTVENTGCGPVDASVAAQITLYDGPNCTGTIVDQWTAELSTLTIAAGGTQSVSLPGHTIAAGLCTSDCAYSVRIEVDPDQRVCECDGVDNGFCISPVVSTTPNLIVTQIDPAIDCRTGTAQVHVTVENTGCGDATGVIVDLTSTGCSFSLTSAPEDIAAGGSATFTLTYTPTCSNWNCDYTATADLATTVCECDGTDNSLGRPPYPGDGSIGDTIWFDADGDGVQDPGEDGIPGVGMTIEGDLDGDGTSDYITAVVTDASGTYLFDDLPAGDYSVTVDTGTLPPGLAQTGDPDGTLDNTSDVALGEGEDNLDQDFGYQGTGSIGDTIWFDADGDGVQDPGEDGIPGVTVTLEGDVDADGVTETITAVTDASGTYLFDDLPAGDYSVTVDAGTLPPGLAQTGDPDGTLDNTSDVALGEGEDNLDQDFGYSVPALSVDKQLTDILRNAVSIGTTGPAEPGDILVFRYVIVNVGGATAYGVEFADTLPTGLVVETDAPGSSGVYETTTPTSSGVLGLTDGAGQFVTSINATLARGAELVATYAALVTSDAIQGIDLVNVASAVGSDAAGQPILASNEMVGDTSDQDVEDPDPDDTGIAIVPVVEPALSVDKSITDIMRNGTSIGSDGPTEPGDVIFFRYIIRNTGLGTAYNVGFTDTLPVGIVTETDPPGNSGTYTVTAPVATGSLGVPDGESSFSAVSLGDIEGGEHMAVEYTARVTSAAVQGVDLVNTATASGSDGTGSPIPPQNPEIGDTADDDPDDSDADDTGSAVVTVAEPALSVDKSLVDVNRRGEWIGPADPVVFGDVLKYRLTTRNVGQGTAYHLTLSDVLPAGIVVETDAPGMSATYQVSSPSSSGSIALTDGGSSIAVTFDTEIAGGAVLVFEYTAVILPTATPAVDLINTMEATGLDGAGGEIPDENAALGDVRDDDLEDPDPDDIGVSIVRVGLPALVTEKTVVQIEHRNGEIDLGGRVEPGDVLTFLLRVSNVGDATAFGVSILDELPVEWQYAGETIAVWPAATVLYTADPIGGAGPTLSWPLDATIAPGDAIDLQFQALVIGDVIPGVLYRNEMSARGFDPAGDPIPTDVSDLVPGDVDPDDRSAAELLGTGPALVTEKGVAAVIRDNRVVGSSSAVATDDDVVFELTVTNVGSGIAYGVRLTDILPSEFAYEAGSTVAAWPGRLNDYTADPVGGSGPTLIWQTDAELAPGDAVQLRFTATVTGRIDPGRTLLNTLIGEGDDGGRTPIEPDRRDEIEADVDPDDRDSVVLRGVAEEPALVTSKRVVGIERDGITLPGSVIEPGDVVRFELRVENVGAAVASELRMDDTLPPVLTYVVGSTMMRWPGGIALNDPNTFAGDLTWGLGLGVALSAGEALRIEFSALAGDEILDATVYTNRMSASGIGPEGKAIPADQRNVVPADSDPDDASEVLLFGRSSTALGGGGIVRVPILRKSAETLAAVPCGQVGVDVDRIWYQTDIARYAASELRWLYNDWAGVECRVPDGRYPGPLGEDLLPTWVRTVSLRADATARLNLVHVDALDEVGIPLSRAPGITKQARDTLTSPSEVLAQRLTELSQLAGLRDEDETHAGFWDEDAWVFLEYAGGEPVFAAPPTAGTWGAGEAWTFYDRSVRPSSIGMGLVQQVVESELLLASPDPNERFLGLVETELIRQKLTAIDELMMVPWAQTGVRYAADAYSARSGEESGVEQLSLDVVDQTSTLWNQLSLLWGLVKVAAFSDPSRWEESSQQLKEAVALSGEIHEDAVRLAMELLAGLRGIHLGLGGQLSSSVEPDGHRAESVETVELGLLLVVLRDAADILPAEASGVATRLLTSLAQQLMNLQGAEGLFPERSDESSDETRVEPVYVLSAQTAAIRGLLAAASATGEAKYTEAAWSAYQATDVVWQEDIGYGVYPVRWGEEALAYCYTPLDVGLLTGAWRELSLTAADDSQSDVLAHLAGFLRTIVDEAALQLSNAVSRDANVVYGTGRGTVLGFSDETATGLAPVLQQRLCLIQQDHGQACPGRTVDDDEPWYQTDIAMYTGYVLQERYADLEDYADSDLSSVLLYSGIGMDGSSPVVDMPSVAQLAERTGWMDGLDESLFDPVVIPYAGASPLLRADDLGIRDRRWSGENTDSRLLSSALGMMLLRVSQELDQLTGAQGSCVGVEWRFLSEWLLAVANIQADVLLRLIEETVSRGGPQEPYAPRVYQVAQDQAAPRMVSGTATDASLFDLASAILGLSAYQRLLQNGVTQTLISSIVQVESERVTTAVAGLLETVALRYLGESMDEWRDRVDFAAERAGSISQEGISIESLTWIAVALEHAAVEFASDARITRRIVELASGITGFIDERLRDGRGGYVSRWPDTETCTNPDFSVHIAALRSLLACSRVLDDPMLKSRVVRGVSILDSLFWNDARQMYDKGLGGDVGLSCYTPIDLAWSLELLSETNAQAMERGEWSAATKWSSRIDVWAARLLDASRLHLPPSGWSDSPVSDGSERYASVFVHRVCIPETAYPESVGVALVEAEDLIRYTIEIENETEETWFDLRLTDVLPPDVIWVSSDPVSTASGRGLTWQLDRLDPGETRLFEITVRVQDGAGSEGQIVNCASLEYRYEDGDPGFTREACAEVSLGSGLSASETSLDRGLRYRTDEAMYLTSALDRASEAWGSERFDSWVTQLLLSNVGVLIAESGMGIPWYPDTESTLPTMGAPVLIPYAEGVPWLALGEGFVSSNRQTTPAALGQTLTAEVALAQLLTETEFPHSPGLEEYLLELLSAQLAWLSHQLSDGGNASSADRLPSTETWSLYDQASLLLGTVQVAVEMPVPSSLRQQAVTLLGELAQQLTRFWDEDAGLFSRTHVREPEGDSQQLGPIAPWTDQVVAAQALQRLGRVLNDETEEAVDLLSELVLTSLRADRLASWLDDAARLTVAAISFSEHEDRHVEEITTQIDQWFAQFNEIGVLLGRSASPREWAIVVDFLTEAAELEVTTSSVHAWVEDAVLALGRLPTGVVLPAAPRGFWWDHAQLACEGWAPVFSFPEALTGGRF